METTTKTRQLSQKDSARIKCQPPYGETCDAQAVVCNQIGLSFFYHCDKHAWPKESPAAPELKRHRGSTQRAIALAAKSAETTQRLEYLRGELRAGRISYGELAELQIHAENGDIDPGDVELLEAAGVKEAARDDHDWEPCTNGALGTMRWFLMRVVNGEPEYLFDVRGYLRRWRTFNAAAKAAERITDD